MRIRGKEKLVPEAGPYGSGPQIVLRYGYLREAERMMTKHRRAEDREAARLARELAGMGAADAAALALRAEEARLYQEWLDEHEEERLRVEEAKRLAELERQRKADLAFFAAQKVKAREEARAACLEHCRLIGERLRRNEAHLVTLDLSQRPVGPEGIELIAAGLRVNSVVTALFLDIDELDIHNPGLQDSGAAFLADALRANSTLEVLSLRNNHVGDAGVLALAAALQQNKSLNQLNLAGNVFSDSAWAALFDAERRRPRRTLLMWKDPSNAGQTLGKAATRRGNTRRAA